MTSHAMPDPPPTVARRLLATAIVVALATAWASSAGASTRGAKPGHHCACAERCKGASCCCPSDAHEEAAPTAPARAEAPAPKPADAPCARSAPCGHPDVPAPGSSRPVSRTAAILLIEPRTGAVPSHRLEAPDDPRPSPGPSSRLDDPPEA